jgi:hypothetical protein
MSTHSLKILSDIENSKNISLGFLISQCSQKPAVDYHEDVVFPAASLIKLPIALLVFKKIDDKHLHLEQKIQIIEQDKRDGVGKIIKSKQSVFSVHELLRLLLAESDNVSQNALTRLFLRKEFNEFTSTLNLLHTRFIALADSTSSHYSTTSLVDLKKIFHAVECTKILNEYHYHLWSSYLEETQKIFYPLFSNYLSKLPGIKCLYSKPGILNQMFGEFIVLKTSCMTLFIAFFVVSKDQHIKNKLPIYQLLNENIIPIVRDLLKKGVSTISERGTF